MVTTIKPVSGTASNSATAANEPVFAAPSDSLKQTDDTDFVRLVIAMYGAPLDAPAVLDTWVGGLLCMDALCVFEPSISLFAHRLNAVDRRIVAAEQAVCTIEAGAIGRTTRFASWSCLRTVGLRIPPGQPFAHPEAMAAFAAALLTACSLNSAVYSCFGIFFTSLPSGLDAIHRPLEDEKRRAAHSSGPSTPIERRTATAADATLGTNPMVILDARQH
ncbi:MAG: hypothetical protein RLZZ598_111 [Pseudomonadota bacterium]|jgi:hypothetical protein